MKIFVWLAAFAAVLATIFVLKYKKSKSLKMGRKSPPEAAGGWPLIGHLKLLSPPGKPHVKLSNLADEYGPIFSIRLGAHRCLIISSWQMAEEIYTKNDAAFSNKPRTEALRIMCYNFAMFAFAQYGPYNREIRKICMLKLLSKTKVSTLGRVWEKEISAFTKTVHDSFRENDGLPVRRDMKKCFEEITIKMMMRIVAGSTKKIMDSWEGERWRNKIREFFNMLAVLTFSDVVPLLKWLDYFTGTKKKMQRTWKALDDLLKSWLEQHKQYLLHKREINLEDKEHEEDFMDSMIGIVDSVSDKFPCYDADTINRATCQAMILAGTDTSSSTLTWAFSLLLNNPRVLKRAQEELDNHVGRSRKLETSDIENLVYIKAIIKETLRLYPASFLVFPRESAQDCVVAGYYVPAGTRMITNVWKLHRDPSVWLDPLEFRPERFLGENRDLDFRGQHFQFLPFGGGRRICPGISFAVGFMELVLATVLHEFNIETPWDEGSVDMEETLGAVNCKATPLHVLLVPRLQSDIYGD